MPFPKTADEMKAQGYTFSDDGTCKGCGDDIEWWKTPQGKNIPMNPMPRGTNEAIAHWSTCTERDSFRSK